MQTNKIKSSISDDKVYPDFCELASYDENTFNNFRNNIKYTTVLEHVTEDEGKIYLEIIKNQNPTLLNNIEKYKTNDIAGTPNKYNTEFGLISPTTIRYIKVLSDLVIQFSNLDDIEIVEIGCGYGGQAKIIMDTFNVKHYTLIDLEPVLKLTKKYLESLNVNTDKMSFITIDKLEKDKKYDLFISNYAYTECTKLVQMEYFNKVIKNSKMGYMTANFINNLFNLDFLTLTELQNMIPNTLLIEEEPKTHINNIVIRWK